MKFTVVIPARYASQRLPGKPLLDIAGQSMIERVYRCAKRSAAERVLVATDHPEIKKVVEGFGGEAVMTSATHPSGTDRLHEVVQILGLDDDAIIVNVQGDEPLIPPVVINQVAFNLDRNPQASAASLSEAIEDLATVFDPNAVKVVSDNQGFALYFSRASIPWLRDSYGTANESLPPYQLAQRHIGIYAYRVHLLKKFVAWPVSLLEQVEKLEQLRILANGHKIHLQTACEPVPGGVDTEHDLQRVRALLSRV